jgi:cyclopropane fatty-acyl-phospholipid synthase-like methyltransferase
VAVGLLIAAGCAPYASEGPTLSQTPDAPYVPTPPEVVAEMLRGARVGANDVVYDLGSGDGRIVIAAARDFGARGVGIDIDAKLVQESRENALRAGVSDKVTFIWKDIFDVDLSPATVVTIYLFPEVNARLVPKLKRELKPGARVVSHEYPLGDWPPDRWIQVTSTVRRHTLRFWTIAAR